MCIKLRWLTPAYFTSKLGKARRIVAHAKCLVLLFLLSAFSTQIFAWPQIVNCDAPVQSRKRGIATTSMSDADFRALVPGVSWYYNWGTTPYAKPADVTMDFLPMAWNGSSSFQTALTSYLAAGNRPWRVFALNEPNLKGQAFMTPSNSAITFRQVKAICDPYNIPVISPHMAIGSAVSDSITAYDPLQLSNVTYTFQEPFLNAFLYYCGSTNPAGLSTHSYGGYGEITWILGTMHADYPTQKIWLTEFCPWDAASNATALATLIPAVDYCERMSWVEGYSWFMSRVSGNPYNSLLSDSGVLTPAGQAYVQMPVHDTNLFYRIPGRLQAERYVALSQMSIAPTDDTNGLADMISAAANGSLDFNIQVDVAGNYPVNFRVAGTTGQIRVYKGATLMGTATVTQTAWSTVSTTVSLTAGLQTLRVVLGSNAQKLNWLDFLTTNGTPSVPANLNATASSNQVALTWSISSGAAGYKIKSSTISGGPYTNIVSTMATSFTNTGLATGTTYYYVVSATNTVGESTNSIQVSATTTVPQVNLALNKPVVVSSTQSGYPATNAVDGNAGTRWSSASSDPQWLYVDLQASYNITRVKLNWEAAYAKSYQIQVSSNAVNWVSIYSTDSGGGGIEDLTGLSGTGRYVRMSGTVRATVYGYSLYELEVYGTVPAPPNQPPVLAAIPDQTILAGRTLLITNSASDANVPPQPLAYSLSNAPAGASIDGNSGVFTWRPTIAQASSTQTVTVVVSDNGSPALTAAQGFTTTVIPPASPALNPAFTNNQFGFWINGDAGPDYTIQSSTNLVSWNPVFTTNSPVVPFFWAETNSYPLFFYRVLLGP
ncbi:MAG: glycosyl hydrolase [Limisphaerales bacterium]